MIRLRRVIVETDSHRPCFEKFRFHTRTSVKNGQTVLESGENILNCTTSQTGVSFARRRQCVMRNKLSEKPAKTDNKQKNKNQKQKQTKKLTNPRGVENEKYSRTPLIWSPVGKKNGRFNGVAVLLGHGQIS